MNCKVCGNSMEKLFTHEILKKYTVQYFQCHLCDYICTEEPYWLAEAYTRPINISDTGLVKRNIDSSNVVSIILYLLFRRDGRYLDYAGGYGIFTRIMRDIGYNFYWSDPFTQNLFANGFEDDGKNNYDGLTAFEVFEHLVNPVEEIQKMTKLSATIIFSTETFSAGQTPKEDWWYFGFNHGQHISFYSFKTLQTLSSKFGMTIYAFNGICLMTKRRISKVQYYLTRFLSSNRVLNDLAFKRFMTSKTYSDHLQLLNQ